MKANSPYKDYPAIDSMSISTRTKELEKTCLEAMKCGWNPERMKGLIPSTLDNEEYELTKAILNSTEKFQKNAQLALFLFDVPESVKVPPEI